MDAGKETMTANGGAALQAERREDAEYRVIDLRRFVFHFWRRRYFVLASAVAGMVVCGALAFVIHPKYDATVRMMPPNPQPSSLSMLLPTRNAGDQYLGLVKSRTVADDVIARQHLAEYFHTTKPTRLRQLLAKMSTIEVDKDQFVSVTVRAKEPETAMRIANEYPAALYRLDDAMTLTGEEHQLKFFEAPLEQEKDKLAEAEEELKEAQQKTGMILPEAQTRLGVGAIADLKQLLAAREEQLAALQTGRTNENPQVVTLRSQIGSLNQQIHQMEAQTGGVGTSPSTAKLPELALEVERKQREVTYHETLFELLSKQYESARLDQAYSPPVELVDRAVLPDQKSWPPRKLFALGGLLIGGFLGMLVVAGQTVGLRRMFRAVLNDPAFAKADEFRT